jgi:hypothetical protein
MCGGPHVVRGSEGTQHGPEISRSASFFQYHLIQTTTLFLHEIFVTSNSAAKEGYTNAPTSNGPRLYQWDQQCALHGQDTAKDSSILLAVCAVKNPSYAAKHTDLNIRFL